MPLRLLEIYHPYLDKESLEEFLEGVEVLGMWQDQLSEKELHTRMILRLENVDQVLEVLRSHFTKPEDLRVIILPVEACFPRRDEWECGAGKPTVDIEGLIQRNVPSRASLEELYGDAIEMAEITPIYVGMIILAAIVAAVGILLDDVAIIIGSMVIAPLLGPNIALTLAVTLADWRLGRVAMVTSLLGYMLALGVGVLFGIAFEVDTEAPQLIARTDFSLLFVMVALAAGVAGALTYARGAPEALVGVMVAVALLPPLVAGGLLLGSENWVEAVGALLLFAVNVLSIKLAGAIIFVMEGVSPSNWLEKEEARRTTVMAIVVWLVLLLFVTLAVFVYQNVDAILEMF